MKMRPANMMCRLVGTSLGNVSFAFDLCRATHPAVMRVVSHVHLTTIVGEVGHDDSNVNETSEDTRAQATDLRRSLEQLDLE